MRGWVGSRGVEGSVYRSYNEFRMAARVTFDEGGTGWLNRWSLLDHVVSYVDDRHRIRDQEFVFIRLRRVVGLAQLAAAEKQKISENA